MFVSSNRKISSKNNNNNEWKKEKTVYFIQINTLRCARKRRRANEGCRWRWVEHWRNEQTNGMLVWTMTPAVVFNSNHNHSHEFIHLRSCVCVYIIIITTVHWCAPKSTELDWSRSYLHLFAVFIPFYLFIHSFASLSIVYVFVEVWVCVCVRLKINIEYHR